MANEAIEAAKLLRELEQEAMKRVASLILPEGGVLNSVIDFKGFMVAASSMPVPTGMQQKLYYRLEMVINGKSVKLEGNIDRHAIDAPDKIANELMLAVFDTVRAKLLECIKPAFKEIIK
jgi:hypothetical protein